MRTSEASSSSGVTTTSVTSALGSHWASDSRTAWAIRPSVLAFTGSKSRSQILHPNSGRMTRSLGAVASTTRIEQSRSSGPLVMARLPRWSTPMGKRKPRPMKSEVGLASRAERGRIGSIS